MNVKLSGPGPGTGSSHDAADIRKGSTVLIPKSARESGGCPPFLLCFLTEFLADEKGGKYCQIFLGLEGDTPMKPGVGVSVGFEGYSFLSCHHGEEMLEDHEADLLGEAEEIRLGKRRICNACGFSPLLRDGVGLTGIVLTDVGAELDSLRHCCSGQQVSGLRQAALIY